MKSGASSILGTVKANNDPKKDPKNDSKKDSKKAAALNSDGTQVVSQGKDKTIIIIGVTSVILLGAFGAIAMISRGKDQKIIKTNINPSLEVDVGDKTLVKGWMSKYSAETNTLKDDVSRLNENIDSLIKRQDKIESVFKEGLQKAVEELKKSKIEQITSPIGQPEKTAQESYLSGISEEKRSSVKMALDDFKDDLTNLSTDPKNARRKLMIRLRDSGMDEQSAKNVVAAESQKAGRYYIGDVEEKMTSMDDVVKLYGDDFALAFPDIVQYIQGLAIDEGKLYPADYFNDIKMRIRAKYAFTANEKKFSNDDFVRKVCQEARVRRENLSDEEIDLIPSLINERNKLNIPRDDHIQTARWLWSIKDKINPELSAGKLLTLTQVLTRKINNTEDPDVKRDADLPPTGYDSSFKRIDTEGVTNSVKTVKLAIENGISMGKISQQDQMDVGMRSLKQFLDAARYSSSEEQRSKIVLLAMSEVEKNKRNQDDIASRRNVEKNNDQSIREPPRDRSTASQGRVDEELSSDSAIPEGKLPFGPLLISKSDISGALFWMVPELASVNGYEPGTAKGASAVIAAYENIPNLVSEIVKNSDNMKDARALRDGSLPRLIEIIKKVDSLSALDIPVSSDKVINTSTEASIMRGVIIGSVYGPFIEDETKARAAGTAEMSVIEKNPPLTKEFYDQISKISDARPWEKVLSSYQKYRPNRIPYPASRYQDVIEMYGQKLILAAKVRDLMAKEYTNDRDETINRFIDNCRILIPMSISIHEDGKMPKEALSAMIDKDIYTFASMYLTEFYVGKKILGETIPGYAMIMSDEYGGAAKLITTMALEVPRLISEKVYKERVKSSEESLIADAKSISEEIIPIAEKRCAEEVVLSRVIPRITKQTKVGNKEIIADAISHVKNRVKEVVVPEYTPARLDTYSILLTNEAKDIIAGKKVDSLAKDAQPAMNGSQETNQKIRSMVAFPPVGDAVGGSTGPNGSTEDKSLVGMSYVSVPSIKVTIPAASYGSAHIITGVSAEIGGTNNKPVVINFNYDWKGPNGSRLMLKNLRLIGTANAMAGPKRISIQLKNMSYVFPSGLSIFVPCEGYVQDNIEGKEGAIGTLNFNINEVMALSTLTGTAKGASDVLKSNGQTQVIGLGGQGTTSTTINNGDIMKQALYGGAAGGVDIFAGYVDGIMKETKASIDMPNGQAVNVMLTAPVTFDVPEKEFDSMTATGVSTFTGM